MCHKKTVISLGNVGYSIFYFAPTIAVRGPSSGVTWKIIGVDIFHV